jgi:glucose-6-phosphate 1-dehydrogenase
MSTSIVIFGASGDLTRRKLIPALFNLHRKDRLPENFRIIGFAKTEWDQHRFQEILHAGVKEFAEFDFSEAEWAKFSSHLDYRAGSFTNQEDFERLKNALKELEQGPADRLYYLATPPRSFTDIVNALGRARMVSEDEGWRRVVIEKPFGTDLASAQSLNQSIHEVLAEKQIYRIDHYLGKETVQNILVFRFGNAVFEPIWNRNYVDSVQITVAEEVGVGHRAGYYDGVGVIRDMFQNHLLQLLSLVAMEPPASFEADALRDEKVKVLKSIRPIPPDQVIENVVRGQYRGYRQEEGVDPESNTATYAALRLYLDNWRWQGVPFYLRSGKRLAEKCTEILIQFKCPPLTMFPHSGLEELTPNVLSICIQPDEGIHQRFEVKVPGTEAEMCSVEMEFHYRDTFAHRAIPDAYERLLLDALQGDPSLFTRSDRAEISWGLIDPIIAGMHQAGGPPLCMYEPGSWGPPEADEFLARDGSRWLLGCGGHSSGSPP